jgi:hypothetical protein
MIVAKLHIGFQVFALYIRGFAKQSDVFIEFDAKFPAGMS